MDTSRKRRARRGDSDAAVAWTYNFFAQLRRDARIEYPLLYVEWVDASRLSDGWMDLSAIPEPYPHRCITVGFLVGENKAAKILVPTIGDIEHPGNRHTYGGMMIPRSAIIAERRLR